MRISPGDLARYWTCPRLFDLARRGGGAMAADRFIAGCLAAVITRYFQLPPSRRPTADIENLVRECWRSARRHRPQQFADRATEQAYGVRVMKLARAFQLSADVRGEPLVVGLEAYCPLTGGCVLAGIIDTARMRPDGTVRVTQYRIHSVSEPERLLEGLLCQSGISSRFRLWVDEIELIDLKAQAETTLRMNRASLEEWKRIASAKAVALSCDREFEPERGDHCNHCLGAAHCSV